MRRATRPASITTAGENNFYPRPPRGGRHTDSLVNAISSGFLSTPSARRATKRQNKKHFTRSISIHALREEGDKVCVSGRAINDFISIHALREEGDAPPGQSFNHRKNISIHALREEGDEIGTVQGAGWRDFYPRPPRGGRPRSTCKEAPIWQFLSTPSARRATRSRPAASAPRENFYPRPPRGGRHFMQRRISRWQTFLSTPSARRATRR